MIKMDTRSQGELTFTMSKRAEIDRAQLAYKGIKSPDLSKCERIRVDNHTIIFKTDHHAILHPKKQHRRPVEILDEEQREGVFGDCD